MGGEISGLLVEFAFGSRQRLLAGIDASGGKLPEISIGCVAILALQQDAGRGARLLDGKNHHRSGVMDNIAADADASWLLDFVSGHGKDWAAVDRA